MNAAKKRKPKSNAEEFLKSLDVQNKALKKILKKLIKENHSKKNNY
ncbi:MAG: hypothetical protein HN778_18950 [Prolixibacteraceae bacterium]|jgi:hypothetical protein|nr:hypothetical protein [Prolixibacteraceae bacterium]